MIERQGGGRGASSVFRHRDASRTRPLYPSLGGIVHTHSTHATAWAQAGLAIPALGYARRLLVATSRDSRIKRRRGAGRVRTDTGKVIIERWQMLSRCIHRELWCISTGCLPGGDAHDAVHNAVVMEEVAKMAGLRVALTQTESPHSS
ncbi:class II aldolase/adducin family protein [Shigella boydii]